MDVQAIVANMGTEAQNRTKAEQDMMDVTLAKEDDEEILTDSDIKYIGKCFANGILIDKYLCNKKEH